MFCAMLEVNPKSDEFDNYFGMAKMLRPELEKIDGFIDNARYASLTRPGWILSLSSWRDEKALVRWSVETHHHKIMQAARDRVLPTIACTSASSSRTRVCLRAKRWSSNAWM
jgi:heme-degrading monooxygenase HmoA